MTFVSVVNTNVRSTAETYSISDDKAFAVWFASVVWELEKDDAYDAVAIEGPNDKGIDLFWIDDQNQQILIAQVKYSSTGEYRPRERDFNTLASCFDWLSSPADLGFEGRPELTAIANDYVDAIRNKYSTSLWFVYLGVKSENIDKRIRVYNENPDNREKGRRAVHYDIELLEDRFDDIRGRNNRIPSARIDAYSNGFEVKGSFGKGLVTSIGAPELVNLYAQYGERLFDRNVRIWLGARKGSVNAGIIDTLENNTEQGNFWAYNNGLTIVCDEYEYDDESGELTLSNFSIVNGCQTTVAMANSRLETVTDKTFVLMRIICPPEELVDSVILYTNSQNPVKRWELVSQNPTQKRLQREFDALDAPIYYAIRKGDWNSLDADTKGKYRSEGRAFRIVYHDLLAQYLASFHGRAVVAYKNKAFLFDRYYEETFPQDLRVEEALFIWYSGQKIQDLVREEIRKELKRVQTGEVSHDKNVRMLKTGGRFYVLAVFGFVCKLRNGTDFLRSIGEQQITSRRADDRITAYSRFAFTAYKQAMSDILEIRKTDLSVLIRESDFVDKLTERVQNIYDLYAVSSDWLENSLPLLR